MTEKDFIRQHGALWKELESETAFFAKRKSRLANRLASEPLNRARIDRFTSLYRQAANHLAYCRTFFGKTETEAYLNRLVGSAHSVIYARRAVGWKDGWRYLASGFPRLFRKEFVIFLIAFLLMALPAAVGYLYTVADVHNAALFIDESLLSSIRAEGNYDEFNAAVSALTGTYIGENNILVCLQALAGGFTLGLYTVYILVTNGVMLGVLGGYCQTQGTSAFFWSLILPHGVTELFAIMLSGMCGLMIAYAFLHPGRYSRKNSMILAGRKAAGIMCVCVLLLVLSAAIEAWFTPLALPYAVKYVFSGGMFTLLLLYLLLPARREKDGQVTA